MLDERNVKALLDRLCVDLGFCLPPQEQHRLSQNPPSDIIAFTEAVFIAEGLNPEYADRHLHRQVRDYVAEAFRCIDSRDDA
ncbi:MAG: hypothetical protein WD944_01365 [Steroidobacteraceae bacterium]